MTETVEIIILARAKGSTAELRELTKKLSDRTAAEMIYNEVVYIAQQLAQKHGFRREREVKK